MNMDRSVYVNKSLSYLSLEENDPDLREDDKGTTTTTATNPAAEIQLLWLDEKGSSICRVDEAGETHW